MARTPKLTPAVEAAIEVRAAMREAPNSDLSPKQRRFVAEYARDLNATQASIRAGYSAKTAHVQGPRLLGNVRVRAAIEQFQARLAEKTEVTVERVVRELAALAFLDPRDLYDEAGHLLPIDKIPEQARRAIASIEVEEAFQRGERGRMVPSGALLKKIKLAAKVPALDLLARHLGMIQAPAPAPVVGPNFQINIHLEPEPDGHVHPLERADVPLLERKIHRDGD